MDEDAPVIFQGQMFAHFNESGDTIVQETLIPAGKKKPAIPEQICLSMPIPEEKS
jgi:hypothetical protein